MKLYVKILIIICILLTIGFLYWYFCIKNEKYFNEPLFHPHYDIRYYKQTLSISEIQVKLKDMFTILTKFLTKFNVKCWLLFGTLLGYYRDGDMIPWDDDIDVGILFNDLNNLPQKYDIDGKYMWDRNPDARHCYHDSNNIVIARLICMETGVFIDIFGQCINRDKVMSSGGDIWDKNDIFPLIQTVFLDNIVYVPQNTKQVLLDVYKNLDIPEDKIAEYEEYKRNK